MILMSMSDDKTLNLWKVIDQIGNIRNNQVNPQHILIWKGQSTIDYNNALPILKCRNIHTDLFKSPKWNDLYCLFIISLLSRHSHFFLDNFYYRFSLFNLTLCLSWSSCLWLCYALLILRGSYCWFYHLFSWGFLLIGPFYYLFSCLFYTLFCNTLALFLELLYCLERIHLRTTQYHSSLKC